MHRRLDVLFLSLALAVFLAITLGNITNASFWFDEAFSSYIIQFNFVEIANYTATDVHPPLYYWALKLWSELFGTTELALRSLSVAFGAATIAVTYFTTRHLFGRKIAAVALVFLALSPMLIRYSDEARMYTVAAFLVVSATAVLIKATSSNQKRWWVLYGVLVSLGMWTHYFTAIVWLAHWAWRAIATRQLGKKGKEFQRAFFTKNWVIAHIVAVGLFLPWIPPMFAQLTVIQSSGFWIGPVGADTLTSYMTNVLFYLDHGQAVGWYGAALAVIVTMLAVLGVRLYRKLGKKQRQSYLLILVLAIVPVLILAIVSLPPLRSSFVERYLLPATIGFSLLAGVTLTLGMAKLKSIWRVIAIGIIAVSMLVGVSNVYEYGNYNKNSGTKVATGEVVKEIQRRAKPGEPIITNTPWVFYEAIFYNTSEHPIYFIDADTEYIYGSLDMLKYNDQHKIKDIAAFSAKHPTVWYMGYTQESSLKAPVSTWEEVQKFSIVTAIDNKDPYKATQFKTD